MFYVCINPYPDGCPRLPVVILMVSWGQFVVFSCHTRHQYILSCHTEQRGLRDFLQRRDLGKLTCIDQADQSSQHNSVNSLGRPWQWVRHAAVLFPVVRVTTIQAESSVPHCLLWRPQSCYEELAFLSIMGNFFTNHFKWHIYQIFEEFVYLLSRSDFNKLVFSYLLSDLTLKTHTGD